MLTNYNLPRLHAKDDAADWFAVDHTWLNKVIMVQRTPQDAIGCGSGLPMHS